MNDNPNNKNNQNIDKKEVTKEALSSEKIEKRVQEISILPECDYQANRNDFANELGISKTGLDKCVKAVKAAKKQKEKETKINTILGTWDSGRNDYALMDSGFFPHLNHKRMPIDSVENLQALLNHYDYEIRNDVIAKKPVIFQNKNEIPNLNDAYISIKNLCVVNCMGDSRVISHLAYIGNQNPINPIMDFITSKKWDSKSRLNKLFNTITTPAEYNRDLGFLMLKRWLISAVAAAYDNPIVPFKAKGVLILQGGESHGKTAFFNSFLPTELSHYMTDGEVLDLSDKDSIITSIQHWIVELGEVDATFSKTELAKLKGFITKKKDTLRMPYATTNQTYFRKTVFCGSVNQCEFLQGREENTRWWVIPVVSLNYKHKINMQQVWAEIYQLYLKGEQWWFEGEEEQLIRDNSKTFSATTPIEDTILKWFDPKAPKKEMRYNATEVLQEIGISHPKQNEKNDASAALKIHFTLVNHSGKKVFCMPEKLVKFN